MQINKSLTHFHNYGNRSDLLSIVCMFFGFRFFLLFHLYICIVDFLLSYCTLEENNNQCSHGSIHMLWIHFAYDYKFVETIRNRIGAQTHTHTQQLRWYTHVTKAMAGNKHSIQYFTIAWKLHVAINFQSIKTCLRSSIGRKLTSILYT